jgi:hypothetical protein
MLQRFCGENPEILLALTTRDWPVDPALKSGSRFRFISLLISLPSPFSA